MGKDIGVLKFKFNPIKKEPKQYIQHNGKLIEALCVKEEDTYKMYVTLSEGNSISIPLTEDSYNLKGRDIVFSAMPEKDGKKTMFIRHEEREIKYSPGLRSQYCTVCEGCIFNGYLVRDKQKQLYFKLNSYVKRDGRR